MLRSVLFNLNLPQFLYTGLSSFCSTTVFHLISFFTVLFIIFAYAIRLLLIHLSLSFMYFSYNMMENYRMEYQIPINTILRFRYPAKVLPCKVILANWLTLWSIQYNINISPYPKLSFTLRYLFDLNLQFRNSKPLGNVCTAVYRKYRS